MYLIKHYKQYAVCNGDFKSRLCRLQPIAYVFFCVIGKRVFGTLFKPVFTMNDLNKYFKIFNIKLSFLTNWW